MRRRTILIGLLLLLLGAVGAAWRWQSQVIGVATRWWLARVARQEQATGDLTRRREVVTRFNRALLMPPPADAMVPELFDLVTLVSGRVASGEISMEWAAKLFTDYQQDMVRDRPNGTPSRSATEMAADLERYLAFYAIQKRPDKAGVTVNDLLGTGDDVITLEEIESGKEIDLKNRGR